MVTRVHQRLLAHLARQQRLARRTLAGGDLPLARALGLLPAHPGWVSAPTTPAARRAPRFVAPLRAPTRPRPALPPLAAPDSETAPVETDAVVAEPHRAAAPVEDVDAAPSLPLHAAIPDASAPPAPASGEPAEPAAALPAAASAERAGSPAAAARPLAAAPPQAAPPLASARPVAAEPRQRPPRPRGAVVELPSQREPLAAEASPSPAEARPSPSQPASAAAASPPQAPPEGDAGTPDTAGPAMPEVGADALPATASAPDATLSIGADPGAASGLPAEGVAISALVVPGPAAEPASAMHPAVADAPRDLFAPPAAPLSAQDWHARLERVARGEQRQAAERAAGPLAEQAPRTAARAIANEPDGSLPAPQPLAPSTRRFLAPRIGIDPASVRVYQDAGSVAVARAARADALAIGDDILLGEDVRPETPEGRGLLAHELTHVARRRDPAFVPPVVRPPVDVVQRVAPPASDEESLARQVETVVSGQARGAQASPESPAFANRPASRLSAPVMRAPVATRAQPVAPLASVPTAGAPRPSMPRGRSVGEPAADVPPDPDVDWGDLPAPWEPLPDWLAPADPGAAGPSLRVGPAPAPAAATPPLVASVNGQPGFIQRAGEERPLAGAGAATPSESPMPAPSSAPAVEPDLDALARQVYAVLRRKLAAEGRRVSGW